MNSVLYPRDPRLLMQPVCHYKTALSRLQDYGWKFLPRRYMGTVWLQWQFLKQHTSALQSLEVARYQTACMRALLSSAVHVAGYQTACTLLQVHKLLDIE
jgi:predicted glycosyltransferase